ncbi:coiled-coil domain-containing protein 14 isoform X3 [Amblyraja radiata]|uniref:coiled-coil domain-containing protein 14 isoform X3 n=1 Tax=Amblyraja radiata TaxID=386614 RepID=UPI0014026413|nr:coiled-coil domain-containing protein 14 isoform X3 [Amblyraja radiata]
MPTGCKREKSMKMKTAKASKVLSSGRLVGSSKQWNGQKRTTGRKASVLSVESGYSLYSTDSEDQVTNIHKGLDRCAALLQDILKNETTDPHILGKTNVTRAKVVLGKEGTKKEVKKNTSMAQHVQKDVVSTPAFKVAPDSAEVGVNNTGHVSTVPEFRIPSGQHSPLRDKCLSDHVETQMGLLNGHVPVNASNGMPARPYNTILDFGSQYAPTFNCRLPTSTPAMSPKDAAHPLLIHHNISSDTYNPPVSHEGLNYLPVYSAPATLAPAVPTSVLAHLVCDGGGSHSLRNQGLHQRKELEQPKCTQCSKTQAEQQGKEPHHEGWKTQTQSQGINKLDIEHVEGNAAEEIHINLLDVTPVKDTIGQCNPVKRAKSKKPSPDKAGKGKTARHLLSELKVLIADQDNSEVLRLIIELEDSISVLPTVIGSTNVEAEVAMSLQPLRSENSQLRRRLRIVNQQLREREKAEKDSRSTGCNFEEVDEALTKMRKIQLKLEAAEKENQILEITLRQRDAEVNRLRELTRTLQGSMERLLNDLSMDFVTPKSKLTRNNLQEYEKHLQDDPGLSSVTAYLKNLNINSVQDAHASSLLFKVPECEQPVSTRIYQNNGMSEKSSPSGFSRYSVQTEYHDVKNEDSKLDETTYIPLAGNACKQEKEPARRECIPVQSYTRLNALPYDSGNSCNGLIVMPHPLDELEKPQKVVFEEIPVTDRLKETMVPSDYSSETGVSENNHIPLRPLDTVVHLPKSNLDLCTTPTLRNEPQLQIDTVSVVDSSFLSFDYRYLKSNCSTSSVSSFNSRDEQNFRNSLAALDANIARLQKSLQADFEINRP